MSAPQEIVQQNLDKIFNDQKYGAMLDFMYDKSVAFGYINEENQKKSMKPNYC